MVTIFDYKNYLSLRFREVVRATSEREKTNGNDFEQGVDLQTGLPLRCRRNSASLFRLLAQVEMNSLL